MVLFETCNMEEFRNKLGNFLLTGNSENYQAPICQCQKNDKMLLSQRLKTEIVKLYSGLIEN